MAYAQIDWHDFVVVETVDYQAMESGNFPAPTTPDEVGARVLMQERLEDGEENEMQMESEPEDEDDEDREHELEEQEDDELAEMEDLTIDKGTKDDTQVYLSPLLGCFCKAESHMCYVSQRFASLSFSYNQILHYFIQELDLQ